MEGDREIVHDGEEKKKKGWFSRKSKPKPPQQHVSRPPSALPIPVGKKSLSDVDDDLPERLDIAAQGSASTAVDSTPGSPKPEEHADVAASLPVDFNLKAMREVIDREGGPASDLVLQAPSKDLAVAPPLVPPSVRSVSAPPPQAEMNRSRSPTPVRHASQDSLSIDASNEAGPSSGRLHSAFTRSMSLNSESGQNAEVYSVSSSVGMNAFAWPWPGEQMEPFSRTDYPGSLSSGGNGKTTRTFGGAGSGIWGIGSSSLERVDATGGSEFGRASITPEREVMTSGDGSGGISTTLSTRPPLLAEDPFALPSLRGQADSAASGGVDIERDFWNPTAQSGRGKSETSGYSSNPWG